MKGTFSLLALGALAGYASAFPAPNPVHQLAPRETNWWDSFLAAHTTTVTVYATRTYCPPVWTPPPTPIPLPGKIIDLGGGNPPVTITAEHQTVTSTVVAGPKTTVYAFDAGQFIDQSQNTQVTVHVIQDHVVQSTFQQIWAPVTNNQIINNIQGNTINFGSIVNTQNVNSHTDNIVNQIQNCTGDKATCAQTAGANSPIDIAQNSNNVSGSNNVNNGTAPAVVNVVQSNNNVQNVNATSVSNADANANANNNNANNNNVANNNTNTNDNASSATGGNATGGNATGGSISGSANNSGNNGGNASNTNGNSATGGSSTANNSGNNASAQGGNTNVTGTGTGGSSNSNATGGSNTNSNGATGGAGGTSTSNGGSSNSSGGTSNGGSSSSSGGTGTGTGGSGTGTGTGNGGAGGSASGGSAPSGGSSGGNTCTIPILNIPIPC